MSRPGFTFCVCPDPALTRRHIAAQLQDFGGSGWKQQVFWADDDLPPAFWEALTLSGLMEESRAVVLRRAHTAKIDFWKQLLPVLGAFNPKVWPFFCLEGEWSRGKPKIPAALTKLKFWQIADKKKWVWSSPGLTRTTLRTHIGTWATSNGFEFAPGAAELATQILPLDMLALDNELAKLKLLLADRHTIQNEDLSVVSFQPDLDIFSFLSALQRKGGALEVWRKVLAEQVGTSSEMVFPFLGLMIREARILWQLAVGEEQAVRLPPWVKKEKSELARRLGPNRLSSIWTLAVETEAGIKTGRRTPDQAMDRFVSGLMALFQQTA